MNLYGFAGGDPVNFSDPFGLKVEYKNDDDGIMERSWNHAKRSLGRAAARGDREAGFELDRMEAMEKSETVYTFSNESTEGYGQNFGNRMGIDVRDILRGNLYSAADQVNVASVMLHESGHRLYGDRVGSFYNWDQSNREAIGRENVYRRSVGWCARSGHAGYPSRGCRP